MDAAGTPFPVDGQRGDNALVAAVLASNDATATEALIRQHHPSLLRLARLYVSSDAIAADVAQQTWLAALASLDAFQPESSLRTWLYRILVAQANTYRGPNDGPPGPFSSTTRISDDPYDGAIDPSRLKPMSDPVEPLHWASFPSRWDSPPQATASRGEFGGVVDAAIEALSPAQREVITLRDILGWEADETASALGITETNQRILLHRARSLVRNRLEEHLRA